MNLFIRRPPNKPVKPPKPARPTKPPKKPRTEADAYAEQVFGTVDKLRADLEFFSLPASSGPPRFEIGVGVPYGMTHPPSGPSTPPLPSGPKGDTKALLGDIDSALIGLLAVAYFSPTVRNASASVRQVCAAEVLLHRLRATRLAVRELAQAYGIESPAHRDPSPITVRTVATTGGPAQALQLVLGDERTPRSAAAAVGGARSDGAVVAPGAGVDFRLPRDIRGPVGPKPPPPPPPPNPGLPPRIGVGPLYDALPVGRCAQGWPSPSTPWPPSS